MTSCSVVTIAATANFHLEAERDVDQEADHHEDQRLDAVDRQFLADLRADRPRCAAPARGCRRSDAARCTSRGDAGRVGAGAARLDCRRITMSLPVPKVCTCGFSKPAASSRLRMSSTSTGLAKRSSATGAAGEVERVVEALGGDQRRPRPASAARSAPATTQRRRMKLKLLSYGMMFNGFMLCGPVRWQIGLELAAAAVDQGGDAARDADRGVHRGQDADDQRDARSP